MTTEEELDYRVRAVFEPGRELQGGHIVSTVEVFLIKQAKVVIRALDAANPRGRDWPLNYGRLEMLLRSLAAVQAGSDYFSGTETRHLEAAIRRQMEAEV